MITLITGEVLNAATTTISAARAELLAKLINDACARYGIIKRDTLHELLANLLQESGEFNHKVESMYYRADTLMKVWPKRFPKKSIALQYAQQPQKLANFVYGSRMGNKPGTDDGWNLRGSGFIGLTGREVLAQYALYKNLPSAEAAAAFARDSDFGALDSAFWFLVVRKDLRNRADADDFTGIVKEINGGMTGYQTRLQYYEALMPWANEAA